MGHPLPLVPTFTGFPMCLGDVNVVIGTENPDTYIRQDRLLSGRMAKTPSNIRRPPFSADIPIYDDNNDNYNYNTFDSCHTRSGFLKRALSRRRPPLLCLDKALA